MYCESQPRHKARSWMDLFPDDAFPNDTPEDKVKSNILLAKLMVHWLPGRVWVIIGYRLVMKGSQCL